MIPGITSYRLRAAVAGGPGEPFYDLVRSLLHFDGNLTDRKGISWTASGNAATSSAQSQFGGSALALDGTGDWIDASDSSFAWGTGDFTLECWVRFTSRSGNNFVFTFGGGWGVYTFSNQWAVFNGVATNVISGGSVSNSTWYHVALSRHGTSLRLFVNGTQIGSTATNSTNFTDQAIRIGAQPNGSGTMTGHVDDFRATAHARYVSGFTAPDAAFADRLGDPFFDNVTSLLHFDGIDGSTTFTDQKGIVWTVQGSNAIISDDQSVFGGTSGFFGSGSRIIITTGDAAFGFGTGDYTIEFWMYPTNVSGTYRGIVDFRTLANTVAPNLNLASGNLVFREAETNRITSGSITVNTWHHVAVSRVGSNTRMFVNGTQVGSTYTTNNDLGSSQLAGLGSFWSGVNNNDSFKFFGYLDDVRVTKGV
jgi:hypothetical protein